MKEDESWEDPKIYFERLEKFALSLGYKYDDEGPSPSRPSGFPTYDMLMEIERLRGQNEYFRGLLDHYKGELIDEHAEVMELQAWKAEVERICRTMNGPNRDTALFIMTNEVEEK